MRKLPDNNIGKGTTTEVQNIWVSWERTNCLWDQFNSDGVDSLSGHFIYDFNCDKVKYCWCVQANYI